MSAPSASNKISWLALILIGTILILLGLAAYYSTVVPPEIQLPEDRRGIIAFATQDLKDHDFAFELDDIDVNARTARLRISHLQGIGAEKFGFQFPYNVSLSLESSYAWKKTPGGNSTYVWCSSCPDELSLTWYWVVQRRTYSTYALVIPFSNKYAITEDQQNLLKMNLGTYVNFCALEDNYYIMTVTLPQGSIMQVVEPNPIHFGRASDQLWFYYDISKYYKEGGEAMTGHLRVGAQPTIYIIFTVDIQQALKENLLFWSGILFGIGGSVVMSGVVEIIKERVRPTSQAPPKSKRIGKGRRLNTRVRNTLVF
jgi:hypothetical protein